MNYATQAPTAHETALIEANVTRQLLEAVKVTDTPRVSRELLRVQGTPKTGALTPFCIQAACARAQALGETTATVHGSGEVATHARMRRHGDYGWILARVTRG